jgi:hypothetical protein
MTVSDRRIPPLSVGGLDRSSAARRSGPIARVEMNPGRSWLESTSPVPGEILGKWRASRDGLAEIPLGKLFDVIRTLRFLGAEALTGLEQQGVPIGPALVCIPRTALEILVPVGTAADWQCPGTTAASQGKTLLCPMPGSIRRGRKWLYQPDGSDSLTDPQRLREALREVSAHHILSARESLAPARR